MDTGSLLVSLKSHVYGECELAAMQFVSTLTEFVASKVYGLTLHKILSEEKSAFMVLICMVVVS